MARQVNLDDVQILQFTAKAGQAGEWPITITDKNGAPIDISLWEMKGGAKVTEDDADEILHFTVTIVNGPLGTAKITTTLEETNVAAKHRALLFDLLYRVNSTAKWKCWAEGTIGYRARITNP